METLRQIDSFWSIKSDGHLYVEEARAANLAREYGTPLYIVSENQLRVNFRRFHKAAEEYWPENEVIVLQSIKANYSIAIRKVLSFEGAGCDAFGENELYAALLGGTDPQKVALNGSSKLEAALRMGIENGVYINMDDSEEIDRINKIATELKKKTKTAIRMRPILSEGANLQGDFGYTLENYMRVKKWGMTVESAIDAIKKSRDMPYVDVVGLHVHVGRQTRSTEHYKKLIPGYVRFAKELKDKLGWECERMNFGGGYATPRDPSFRKDSSYIWGDAPEKENTAPNIEMYLKDITDSLRENIRKYDLKPPAIQFETGRYLHGNISILVSEVGSVKTNSDNTYNWVCVDTSINHMPDKEVENSQHDLILVERALEKPCIDYICDITGPICMGDVLASQINIPRVQRGSLIAFLDVGAYADSESRQCNAFCRPAMVMVNGKRSAVIKERETLQYMFMKDRIPNWLLYQPATDGK